MIALLALGLAATLACLALQALAFTLAARYFAHASNKSLGHNPRRTSFLRFSALMSLLMLGNLVQIAFWALLYRALGAFDGFETALYFSGVTFTTLGYGDVVLPSQLRLLAPLQAANGLMMFGITTAAFIAAIQQTTAKRASKSPGLPGKPLTP